LDPFVPLQQRLEAAIKAQEAAPIRPGLTDADAFACIEALKARARGEIDCAILNLHKARWWRGFCAERVADFEDLAERSTIVATSLALAIQRLRAMRRALAADDAVAREGAVCADRE
jgi:hypothetical protein